MVFVLDNYDSFTYNLVQYLGELGAEVEVRRNDQTTPAEVEAMRPERIVLSPGPCTPQEAGITIPLIRHHVSNLMIDVVSPTEARGMCYFLAVTEHGVDHWGRYRDRYLPEGDRWLFEHRYVRTDGATRGGWARSRQAQ